MAELFLKNLGLSRRDRLVIPNIKLCAWLLSATKDKKIKAMPDYRKVLDSYLKVWKMAGTKDEKQIEVQHLNLLIEALTIITPTHVLLAAVTELRDKLSAAI